MERDFLEKHLSENFANEKPVSNKNFLSMFISRSLFMHVTLCQFPIRLKH